MDLKDSEALKEASACSEATIARSVRAMTDQEVSEALAPWNSLGESYRNRCILAMIIRMAAAEYRSPPPDEDQAGDTAQGGKK